MKYFKLSAVLKGHSSDVRATLLPDPSLAITASRDGSSRIWKRTAPSPPTYDPAELSHSATFKTCVAYASEVKGFPEGLVFIGDQTGIIEARRPETTSERNADALMIGHANHVSSLDVNLQAGYLVSGSWDHAALVWRLGEFEPKLQLQGHTAAVWAVLAYDDDNIVTGCADQVIRIFDTGGKLKTSFNGKDIVRALAKLPPGHKSGGNIVSATNDYVIRIWTLTGQQVSELFGHESYIYSLAVLPSGEILSSGEDRTVRIWDGPVCQQVITLPAISIWSVAACPNGDLVAGSSDKIARIFTRNEERFAVPEEVAEFEQSVQASSIPQQPLGEINKTDAPGPEFLQRKSGTKEGQIQLIKETDGSIWAYSWSNSLQKWDKVGQVMDSAAPKGERQEYKGKKYDYVFDVDIEDGKPPLKLPYNISQNTHEAAMKFLQDNELPMSYLDEVANFIIKNTTGASLGSSAPTSSASYDPWGSGPGYQPGSGSKSTAPRTPSTSPQNTLLPLKAYTFIVAGNLEGPEKQIRKLNAQYVASGDTQMMLSETDLESIGQLFQELRGHKFEQGQPTLQPTPAVEKALPIALKIATKWDPVQNRLAGLDLLRFVAAAVKGFPEFPTEEPSIVSTIALSGIFDKVVVASHPKLAMLGMRFFNNLIFASELGQGLLEAEWDVIFADVKITSPLAIVDHSMGVAFATFFMNLAVYSTSEDMKGLVETAVRALSLVEEMSKFLRGVGEPNPRLTGSALSQSTEPVYRALVALGTIFTGLKDKDIAQAAVQVFDVPRALAELGQKGYLKELRFQRVVDEIQTALA